MVSSIPNPRRPSGLARSLAVIAVTLLAASCGGGNAAKTVDPVQSQILALEAADHENGRLIGQLLSQNAQLRDDLAASVERQRELQGRIEALERRVNENTLQTPATTDAAKPDPIPKAAPAPRRTPVAVRLPGAAPHPAENGPLRLDVSIRSGESWQPLYANTSDRSQKIRIRRTSAGAPSRIRLAPAGAVEIAGGPPLPTWELPATGDEKWLTIGCGQEIAARGDDTEFALLVRADPRPDLCSDRSEARAP